MRWRRWSELSQVERVDLYTRQSLYVLLWASVLFLLGAAGAEPMKDQTSYAVAVGAVLLLAVVATAALREVTDLYPARGPVPWRTVGPLLALAGVLLAGSRALPIDTRAVVVFQVSVCLAWTLGGLRDPRWTVGLLVGLLVVPSVVTGALLIGLGMLLTGGFLVFTVRISLWLLAIVTELDAARGAQAQLAVAEERLRFSRDVHDVLGRRLSTIAVQSELAAALAKRGDPEAPPRMLEVRELAHAGLREARELARGYRPTDLGQELEGARSLLRSAGIDVRLDVDDLPAGWHEAAGWIVRESVTNVLRHSTATLVEVEYADGELRVSNDGAARTAGVAGAGAGSTGGSGLAGLRERLAPLGAGLTTEQRDGTWRLAARLPGPGPLLTPSDAGHPRGAP